MLRLPLLASLFYTAFALCPAKFELARNGECYRQMDDGFNMDAKYGPETAVDECDDYGAKPVIIRNKEDNDYWTSIAVENHKKGDKSGFILLGIECSSNQHYRWVDGSSIDFKPDDYDPELTDRCDNTFDSWAWRCMWVINPVSKNWQEWCNRYHSVDLYCVFIPDVKAVEPDSECGSFSNEGDDVCYQVGMTSSNWTEANTICHSFGANVASIHNDQENNFLRRLSVSKGLVNGLMLGATWSDKKSKFKWADGTKWDYDNFASGFPINGAGECLAMETNNVAGQWVNVDCASQLPFACVRPTDAKVPTCDGSLHQEGDIIYSPGFPSSSSESCDFLLKVEEGMLVEVEILFLEANECCDHLVLFEGTLGGNFIASLSGEHENGKTYRTSSQNVMRASWQPNGGVNVRGMMITFRGVPK